MKKSIPLLRKTATTVIICENSCRTKKIRLQGNPAWQILKQLLSTFIVLLYMHGVTLGQIEAASAQWSLTSGAASKIPTGNITAENHVFGSGLTNTGYTVLGARGDNWNPVSMDDNDYHQYSISTTSGKNLTVTQIYLYQQGFVNGNAAIYYSTDLSNFNTTRTLIGTFTINSTKTTETFSGLSINANYGETLYIRVYGWGATNPTDYFYNQNFTIEGTTTTPSPTLSVDPMGLIDFGEVCQNATEGPERVTIIGTYLNTENISVGPLNCYTFSTNADGTYASSLSLTQSGGTYSQDIFIKFTPTVGGNYYNGDIPVIGGGTLTYITVTGYCKGVPSRATNPIPANGATGVSYAGLDAVSSVSWDAVSGATSYDVYFGTGSIPGTPTATDVAINSYSTGVLSGGTKYYWKVVPKNECGATSAIPVIWTFTTVTPPNITVSAASLDFGALCVNSGWSEKSYTVSGTSLTGPIEITPPSGFEISAQGGASFNPGSILMLNPSNGTLSDIPIYIRFVPTTSQAYSGNITHNSTGATTKNVAVTGNGKVVPSTATNPSPANGASGVCYAGSGTVSSVSWSAVSGATSYDVYFGPGSLPGSPITVNTNSYSTGALSASTTYHWKVVPKNDCGSTAGTPVEWTFTTNDFLCYCKPSSNSTSTYINAFSATGSGTSNISNNATGYTSPGYADYSASQSVSQYANNQINWSLTFVTPGGVRPAGFSLWVDWDKNGFGSGDNVYITSSAQSQGTYTGSFTVPSDQAPGNYRMRVFVDAVNGIPNDPCNFAYYYYYGNVYLGEAEDYTVIVTEGSCTPPVPTFTALPTSPQCTDVSVTYTTQDGKTNYIWSIPGTEHTDYEITSGGTSSNTVTLTWLTAGSKTVTVNYTEVCQGETPASSTITVNQQPVADAGESSDACGLSFMLNATASVGTGTWTKESGTGNASFNVNANDPDATVTVDEYGAYVFRWTEVNGPCSDYAEVTVTFYLQPTPTFTASPTSPQIAGDAVTYTTQASKTNYVWNILGIQNTDYKISSGGTNSDNTVTLTWLTGGSKTVTVNYTEVCQSTTPASSTITVVSYCKPSSNTTETYINSFSATGSGTSNISNSGTGYTTGGYADYSASQAVSQYANNLVNWSLTFAAPGGWRPTGFAIWVDWNKNGFGSGDNVYVTGSAQSPETYSGSFRVPSGQAPGNYRMRVWIDGVIGSPNNPCIYGLHQFYGDWYLGEAEDYTLNVTEGSCTPPTPTFTLSSSSPQCTDNEVTYTTQAGMTNYMWGITGTAHTDYEIVSGGTSSDNTLTLTWVTSGSKTVTVNYTEVCQGETPASSTITVNQQPVADAGESSDACGLSFMLDATPSVGTGTWTKESGTGNATFDMNANDPDATVTVDEYGTYVFRWTEVNGPCIDYDEVTVNFNQQPTPTFTASPTSPQLAGDPVTYTTQAGKTNYEWNIPGIQNTDYKISSGGTNSDNTVTLTWLTGGSKTVTVNYTEVCQGTTPASSTITVVSYCKPSSNDAQTYINNFSATGSGTSNISNSGTGYTTGGYADYSASQSVSQYANNQINWTLTIVTPSGGGTTRPAGFTIWMDWDKDGFDSGEKVYTTSSAQMPGTYTGSFPVPQGQTPENYRMRVIVDAYSDSPNDPCNFVLHQYYGNWYTGEAEDYTVNVIEGSCTPPDAPTAEAQSFCSSESHLVSNLYVSGQEDAIFKWYDVSEGGTPLAETAELATGTYYVSQTVENCESERKEVGVTVNTTPFASISGNNGSICYDQNAEFYITGAANAVVMFSLDGGTTTSMFMLSASGDATLSFPGSMINGPLTLIRVEQKFLETNKVCTQELNETSTVNVNPLPIVNITGTTTIFVGSTTTLSPLTGGFWTSNDDAIATYIDDGLVTGISAGTATFTFTDETTGCSATTGEITVLEDNVPPVAVCKNITVDLDETGEVSIVAADVDGGSSDNNRIESREIDIDVFTCENVGTNTVTLMVTDANGLSSSCTAMVTVHDVTLPEAVCQSITVQLDGTGNASIIADEVDGGSSDNCGIATREIDKSSFTCENIGPNTVTLTITDKNGLKATCQSTFSVVDKLSPTITSTAANLTVECDGSGNIADYQEWLDNHAGAAASDNCGGTLTWTYEEVVVINDDDEEVTWIYDCGTKAKHISVTFYATDASKNKSSGTTAVFKIVDHTPPTITKEAENLTVSCSPWAYRTRDAWLYTHHGGAVATDQCSGITWHNDFSLARLSDGCGNTGSQTVTFTAADACGNYSTTQATYTIQDKTAPYVETPALNASTVECAGKAAVPNILPVVKDLCSGTVLSPADITPDPVYLVYSDDVEDFVSVDAEDFCEGLVEYNFEYVDECENTFTWTYTYTIDRTTPPEVLWRDIKTGNTVECLSDAKAPWEIPNGQDICGEQLTGVLTSTVDYVNGEVGTITCEGTRIYTYTYTDCSGLTNTWTFTNYIDDTRGPTASNPLPINVQCSSDIPAPDITVVTDEADNCGGIPVVEWIGDLKNGGCDGYEHSFTRTYSVTDCAGNSIEVDQTINVKDIALPTITCKDATVALDAGGSALIELADVLESASDNCNGDLTFDFNPKTFTCADLPGKVVTVTATDCAGNTNSCDAYVTIVDNIPPEIVYYPASGMASLDENCEGVMPDLASEIIATDNCLLTIEQWPLPGTKYLSKGGEHQENVSLTVSDGTSEITFGVYVYFDDKIEPSIICPGDQTVVLDANCAGKLPDYTALATVSDNCTAAEDIIVTQSPAIGTSYNGEQNVIVTLTANDGNANLKTCTFNVHFNDQTAPMIEECLGLMTVILDSDCNALMPDYTESIKSITSDNCGVWVTQNPAPGTPYSGDQTVEARLTADDHNGNTSNCDFKVHFKDGTPPVITCPDAQILAMGANCSASLPDYTSLATKSDNCSTPSVSQSPVPGTKVSDVGSLTVTLTADDGNGNSAKCSFIVNKVDNTPPAAICKNVTVYLDEEGNSSVTYDQINNGSSDNCLIDDMTVTPGSFTCANLGNNTVTLKVYDASGNSNTCTAIVNVVDKIPPTITCPETKTLVLNGSCSAILPDYTGLATKSDNCATSIVVTQNPAKGTVVSGCGDMTVTLTANDGNGNTSTCSFIVTKTENTPPTISSQFASPRLLWPPNHKMINITLSGATDNCGNAGLSYEITSVQSNESINGTDDGNTSPDWALIDGSHLQLRAERDGSNNTPDVGRIYTITWKVTDACGNTTTATDQVTVGHNITDPPVGKSVAINNSISLGGTFWDVPGNRHTAKWLVDGTTVNGTVTTEPAGNKLGKVTGSYKPTVAGVYKLRMNITDQNKVTSYATTNGDFEAYFVAYDPSGGYTYGAGSFTSPVGSLPAKPSLSDKVKFGFTSNYYKNATNPRGETQLEFALTDGIFSFEFSALNYDYLMVNNARAVYKGLGKTIINGVEQSGYNFIMSVIDGQATGGGGSDRIRLKIYNKNTQAVVFDNQPGGSDTSEPTMVCDDPVNSIKVVASPTKSAEIVTAVTPDIEYADLKVYPNPFSERLRFEFVSPEMVDARIELYDMTGRLVKTIFEQPIEGGTLYEAEFRPKAIISAVYFYRVTLGDAMYNGKVIFKKE